MASTLLFSTFEVSRQAFFRTATTAAIVNLKPLVPGHVLVIPTRIVPRMSDLTPSEVSSLFSSVQTVGNVVQKAYKADGLTIACQDGQAAGQSVPHVHVHIIPRKLVGDRFSNNDDVYPELENHDEVLHKELGHLSKKHGHETGTPSSESSASSNRSSFRVDNESRKPRTLQEMEEEAEWLKSLMPTEDTN
ncbi:diadenosine tetraphosphate asymmetrical hydrolase [Serendipita vermifera]|nr:diadenosine tetraphosphate asymmetrical hydrolase [Serendipita vermifera]